MSDTPDTLDTAALRELLAQATPGPWTLDTLQESTVTRGSLYAVTSPGWRELATVYGNETPELEEQGAANGPLIVAAVNALPALLDRLETAERERLSEQRRADDNFASYERVKAKYSAAESALSASRAEVAARAQGNAQDAVLIRALRGALTQVQHEAESFQWADGMPAKAGRVAMQIVAEVASRALAEKGDGR